jgi:hypothetical protein
MSRLRVAVAMMSPRAPGLPRRAEGVPVIAASARAAPGLDPSRRRAEGLPVIATSPRAPRLDPSRRRAEGLQVIAASPHPPRLDPSRRRAEGFPVIAGSPRAPRLDPSRRRAGGPQVIAAPQRAPQLDPSRRRAEGLPVTAGSPRPPRLDPSRRRAEGLPVIAASRAIVSGLNAAAVPLTIGQPSIFSLSLLPWSMRRWQSARARWLWAGGLPGSHGPFESRVNEQKIEVWLTSRRPAALRSLPARGHFVPARRRPAGRPCRGLGQDGSLARGPGQEGSRARNPGQHVGTGGAAAGLCLKQAVESTSGAQWWRPPAS